MHRNRQTRLDPVQEIDALFGVHRDSPEQYACPSRVDDRCVDVRMSLSDVVQMSACQGVTAQINASAYGARNFMNKQ